VDVPLTDHLLEMSFVVVLNKKLHFDSLGSDYSPLTNLSNKMRSTCPGCMLLKC